MRKKKEKKINYKTGNEDKSKKQQPAAPVVIFELCYVMLDGKRRIMLVKKLKNARCIRCCIMELIEFFSSSLLLSHLFLCLLTYLYSNFSVLFFAFLTQTTVQLHIHILACLLACLLRIHFNESFLYFISFFLYLRFDFFSFFPFHCKRAWQKRAE